MDRQSTEIVIAVAGWPPIKNEATSLLAAGHGYADRVRALLIAARDEVARTGWTLLESDVEMDVVVRGPARPQGDATNFLGGIGDVLQYKIGRPNLDLVHLDDLAAVAIFRDDRQVRRLSYREEMATEPGYVVRVHPGLAAVVR